MNPFNTRSVKMAAAIAAALGIGCAAGAYITTGAAATTSDFKQGELRLQRPASPFDDKGVHIVKLGDKLDVECRFYLDDFFDTSIIWAGANITNPTSETRYFEYNVAFFDERGQLVGCASQGSFGGIEPQQTTQLGSCLITLEPQDIASVRSYQVRVYESTREVGALDTLASE